MTSQFPMQDYLLLFAMCYLSVTVFICLIRAVLGPRFTDRLVAVNIIGVKGIVLILVGAYYLRDTMYVDIAIVYALLSFLSVVVLCKLFMKRHYAKQLAASQKEVLTR